MYILQSKGIFWYALTMYCMSMEWKSTIMDLIIALFGWHWRVKGQFIWTLYIKYELKGLLLSTRESGLFANWKEGSILNLCSWQLYWVDPRKLGGRNEYNIMKNITDLNYLSKFDIRKEIAVFIMNTHLKQKKTEIVWLVQYNNVWCPWTHRL